MIPILMGWFMSATPLFEFFLIGRRKKAIILSPCP
jgi:hypothetical protein